MFSDDFFVVLLFFYRSFDTNISANPGSLVSSTNTSTPLDDLFSAMNANNSAKTPMNQEKVQERLNIPSNGNATSLSMQEKQR